jgi:hypothetical protein
MLHASRNPSFRIRARALVATLLTAGALSTLAACGEDSGPRFGTLAVVMTDAPFPFESVARAEIHVVRVDARLAEPSEPQAAQDADGSENGDDPSRGWVTIATPDRTIDLLELQRGVVTDLGLETIPTGTYRGFRLVIDTDQSSLTLTDGTVLRGNTTPGVQWPSAGQSGIKVKLAAPVRVTGDTTVLVLDFDLGNSFVLRGNTIAQNGLLFKPVIRAVARDITGAVSGTVRAGSATGTLVANASVEVLRAGTAIDDTDANNVVATTSTDASGAYMAAFLLPGSYALRVTPPATLTGFGPALVPSVTVLDGQVTGGQLIVLPAR